MRREMLTATAARKKTFVTAANDSQGYQTASIRAWARAQQPEFVEPDTVGEITILIYYRL